MSTTTAYRLSAEPRLEEERNPRALRRRGYVPAVLYGPGLNRLLKVRDTELERLLHRITRSSRITLQVDGEEWQVFIKEIQYDLLTERVIHVDFYWPGEGREVEIDVPVILRGEPEGRKMGGALRQLRDTVRVKGLPERIPEKLEVDVSGLGLDEAVRVEDLNLEEMGLKPLTAPEVPLAIVRKIRVEVAAAPVEGEAPAEAPEGEAPAEEAEGKEEGEGKEGAEEG